MSGRRRCVNLAEDFLHGDAQVDPKEAERRAGFARCRGCAAWQS